ncbi:MAG: ATP synthase subunit b 2 [Alphaproteobacteria bacterium ADurb.Bin438]|nr:MAG: ATP synthase subunit b 2 [Alphaproteobacteria bacterium ADurb.Bin438]
MPQLDPTWFPSQIFWLCLCFMLMFIGVKFIMPTFDKIFMARNKIIDDNIKVAFELRDEAKKVLKAYEEGIASANEKSDIVLQNARQEINDFLKEKEEEFNVNSSKMLEESNVKIKKASQEAFEEVKKMSVDLTMMIYSKVTNKDILKEDVEEAVNKIMKGKDSL